jgi:LmbE family N-acetylglucosaminyl deacetylase
MMIALRGIEAFDEVQRLIVIGAHADDAETMCGSTLALLARRGVTIFLANCTLGDLGTQDPAVTRPALAATRMAETAAAARILRIAETYNLGHHDGELLPSLELRAQLAHLYRITGADTLFTFDPFWSGQIHPDHRAAGQAAIDAFIPAKMPLYRPEQLAERGADLGRLERIFLFATQRQPDIYVDVTPVYDVKIAASLAHGSQFPEGEANLEWMKELDRAAGEVIGAEFAEPFRQVAVW